MAADQRVPASDVPPSLPDPFSQVSRFERLTEVLEPLAAEFWTARKPLKDTFIALEHGWDDDRARDAALCLAVGDELRKVKLVAFPSEMANAVKLDAPPTPEQIATQAMWCVLAAAVAGDDRRVNELVEQIISRPAVRDELTAVLPLVADTCLAKWRCATSPYRPGGSRD
jgi:hypothetical protein